MRALDRAQDALGLGQHLERGHRVGVGDSAVVRAAAVAQPGVLGPDAGVVEAGADRVRVEGLAVVVLHQVAAGAVQHAGRARRQRRRVPAGLDAVAAGLAADQRDGLVRDERVEDAHRVAAAADAGDHRVGQPADEVEHLLPRLDADDALEVADHHRERVRPDHGADDVVRRLDVGDPVAERLVGRVLERLACRC